MRSHFSFDIYFIYMLMYTLFTFFVSFAPTPFWVLFFWSSFAYSASVDCFLLREIIRINCSCLCKNKWSIPTNTYNSIKGWLRETEQFFSATAQKLWSTSALGEHICLSIICFAFMFTFLQAASARANDPFGYFHKKQKSHYTN